MLYYQPLKIKSYKMRLIFIIFIFLMMPACSWLDSNSSDEDNIPVGQEDDDTDISVIPLINIITKFLPETYRQDISQGNEITPEMLLEIKAINQVVQTVSKKTKLKMLQLWIQSYYQTLQQLP